ncbi:phage tail protein [Burkholderia cenocepacia]|uniref:phage tail protein n=1 Tax=Burkholderia cenocepacia TaxID=95486 RepID=UPI0021178262|nr:phage tail protein [Burkholderia cenocepacia]
MPNLACGTGLPFEPVAYPIADTDFHARRVIRDRLHDRGLRQARHAAIHLAKLEVAQAHSRVGARDLFPQVGAVMRSFNATQASIGSILKAVDGSNFPLVRAAADSVKSALGGAWNQFNAAVGLKDSAVMDVIKSTGVGSMLSGLVDGASSSTPHLMTMTTDAGDAFHFNLSTAAHDKLRRATRYRVASQERLNRQEALQPVSEGGETITLSGVVFPSLGAGTKQITRLRAIGGRMKPVQLTTGDGEVLGRWLLQAIEEEQDALLADGLPRKQTFSVEFGRYGEDFKNV